MELLVVIPLAVVVALITLVLCDLAGDIARGKGHSYWVFFAFGLLLWFPALLTALNLADRTGVAPGADPSRAESAAALVVLVLGGLTALAAVAAAVVFSP